MAGERGQVDLVELDRARVSYERMARLVEEAIASGMYEDVTVVDVVTDALERRS
jgi:hypothetical protein